MDPALADFTIIGPEDYIDVADLGDDSDDTVIWGGASDVPPITQT